MTIEQIDAAIKEAQDSLFYAETAPKSAIEMQMLITRVEVLLRLKYQLIIKG